MRFPWYAGVGDTTNAETAVENLLRLRPDFSVQTGLAELVGFWNWDEGDAMTILQGLEKAGLITEKEPAAAD